MGGSKPTPPTIIMPEESNPQAFQTIIPQKSYKDLAESMRRTEKEINRITGQRYDEVGTPAEIGAQQRAIEMQEAASYKASLPRGGSPDERFKETPRPFPIKSNRRATFDTVPGTMDGFGGSRPNTGPGPTRGEKGRRLPRRGRGPIPPEIMYSGGQSPRGTQPFQKRTSQVGPPPGRSGFFRLPRKPSNPAKEAASMRYNQAKSNYFDALNKAKTKKPTFMPETVNPGFAQNKDDLYLPKIINAPDEKK
tara:strand:+ start:89 stop:838 length:750 start_codon:yes stop_codon:yes gene_type:complete